MASAPDAPGSAPTSGSFANALRARLAGGEAPADVRLFAEPPPAGGCASGECLPGEEVQDLAGVSPGPGLVPSYSATPAGALQPAASTSAGLAPPASMNRGAALPQGASTSAGLVPPASMDRGAALPHAGSPSAGLASPASTDRAAALPHAAPSTSRGFAQPASTDRAAALQHAASTPPPAQAAAPHPAAVHAPGPAAASTPPGEASGSSYQRDRWRGAVEAVRGKSGRHGASLAHGRLLSMKPGEVRIGFTRASAFHRTAVAGATGKDLIERALAEHLGQPTRLVIEADTALADAAGPSLAEHSAQAREAHERSTDGMVRNHPAVRAVLAALGGEVEHIQVLQPERPDPAAAQPTEPGDDAG